MEGKGFTQEQLWLHNQLRRKLRAHKGRLAVTGGGADCLHVLQVGEQTACTCYRWGNRLPARATGGRADCLCHKLGVLGCYFSDSANIIALNDDKQSVCVCACVRSRMCVTLWWRVQCSHTAIYLCMYVCMCEFSPPTHKIIHTSTLHTSHTQNSYPLTFKQVIVTMSQPNVFVTMSQPNVIVTMSQPLKHPNHVCACQKVYMARTTMYSECQCLATVALLHSTLPTAKPKACSLSHAVLVKVPPKMTYISGYAGPEPSLSLLTHQFSL